MKTLYIFSKDLRLSENQALSVALKSESLAFCYLLPRDFMEMGEQRKSFLLESLESLEVDLKEKGFSLYLINNINDLSGLDVDQVVMSKAFNSKDKEVYNDIKNEISKNNTKFLEVENSNLYSISSLPFSIENLPKGFTSFRKKIEKNDLSFNSSEELIELPKSLRLELQYCKTIYDETLLSNKDFKGGEKEALKRLHEYLWEKERARTYKETRNGMIEFDDSTKFSPWLALGCISPITIMEELLEFEEKIEKNESTYWIYFELMWREFFKLYSLKYGEKIFEVNGLGLKTFEINESKFSDDEFEKWRLGVTKEPFVNANMIELLKTGWMSNRGRQNVASYLSKNLCLDWRWGALHFQKHLIDYDVESNWGNWNYNAGVGVDPRDRTFNIKRQADMYDAQGEYQKKWL